MPPRVAVLMIAAAACGASNDAPACTGCTITRETVEVLSAADSAQLGTQPVALRVPAAGLTGNVIADVAADGYVVADNAAGVLRVVRPGREPADTVRLPPNVSVQALAVLRWPDVIIFSGTALRRRDLFRAAVRDGHLIIDREFRAPAPPRRVRAPEYRLAARNGGGLWAGEASSYMLLELDADGELLRRIRGPVDWSAWLRADRPQGRLPTRMRALAQDGEGRLWIYSRVPTSLAGPAWREASRRGTMPYGPEELYDTVVEVREPTDMSVVARARMDGHVEDVLDDGRVVMPAEQGRTVIYRLALRRD